MEREVEEERGTERETCSRDMWEPLDSIVHTDEFRTTLIDFTIERRGHETRY